MTDFATTLEAPRVVAELRKLAAEQPDFVYKSTEIYQADQVCRYTDYDGNPSCIVGHVVKRVMGEDALDKLHHLEENVGEFGVCSTYWPEEFGADEETQTILTQAQNAQDSGETWSFAVEKALKSYNEVGDITNGI